MPIFSLLRPGRPHASTSALALTLACAPASWLGCGKDELQEEAGSRADDGSQGEPKGPDAGRGTNSPPGTKSDSGRAPPKSDAGRASPLPASQEGPEPCAKAELTTERLIPKVWLLVDGSGSMGAGLNGVAGPSRWAVLRQALLEPTSGLVARLQGTIAFGLLVYDGGLSPPGVYSPLCPRVIAVEPALDNHAALEAAYPAQPTGASTPTHYALIDLKRRIDAAPVSQPGAPTYVVLATDGKPNLCDFHDGIPASAATEQEAVDTVATLASEGTRTFAVSLAGDDLELQAHLESLARAGDTGKSVFSPTTQDALADALGEILGGTASCEVRVEGTIVPGRECAGDVTLNGQVLLCDDPDGYSIGSDKQTLELRGAACGQLRNEPSATLKASFACEDVLI